MNRVLILFLSIVCVSNLAKGQNQKEDKYFSIGTKTSGICFGNSIKFNGIRFNTKDMGKYHRTLKINGINLSLGISNDLANGIQIGIALIEAQGQANGINIAGFGITGEKMNGLAIASLGVRANAINGVGASLHVGGDTLCGIFIGAVGIGGSGPDRCQTINGLAVGVIIVGADKINGITITGWSHSETYNGLSIAVYNQTEKLHGLQIGILNHAANNPPILRWLPLINFHP